MVVDGTDSVLHVHNVSSLRFDDHLSIGMMAMASPFESNRLHVPVLLFPAGCFLVYADRLSSLEACFRLQLHSSYALPAPKPTPTQAGHALRLKRRTEKTTPKPRPREDLMSMLERQRSH